MKRLYSIIFILVLCLLPATAQNYKGNKYITLAGGYSAVKTGTLNVSYEKCISYDVSLSLDGEMGYKFKNKLVTDTLGNTYKEKQYYWDLGIVAKKQIVRYKNAVLRAFVGGHAGAHRHDFFVGASVGLEYDYIFPNSIHLFIQQKNQVNFIHNDLFQNGVLVGIKLPI